MPSLHFIKFFEKIQMETTSRLTSEHVQSNNRKGTNKVTNNT